MAAQVYKPARAFRFQAPGRARERAAYRGEQVLEGLKRRRKTREHDESSARGAAVHMGFANNSPAVRGPSVLRVAGVVC